MQTCIMQGIDTPIASNLIGNQQEVWNFLV